MVLFALPYYSSYAIWSNLTDHIFPRHFHEEYHVTVMVRGSQRSSENHVKDVIQKTGEIITSNPGDVHDGSPISDSYREFWSIYFHPHALQRLYNEAGVFEKNIEWGTKFLPNQELLAKFLKLFYNISQRSSQLSVEVQMLTVIGSLIQEKNKHAIKHTKMIPSGIERVRQMINDDPARNYTIAELAIAAGLTQYQVVHGFQRKIGLAPHAYQIQRRISLAKTLIQRGVPLAYVAADCGFSDQPHMSRLFKVVLGISPSWLKPHSSSIFIRNV